MPDAAGVLGLARLVPLALGVAVGTIVTGVVAIPGLRTADTATGLYVIDDEPTRPDLSAALEDLAPSTAPVPPAPPVVDLESTLIDLSSRGFTPLAAESPFDGPLDVVEAASFVDVDAAGYQRVLEQRGFSRGHAVLWTDAGGRIAAVIALEFGLELYAREHHAEARWNHQQGSPEYRPLDGLEAFTFASAEGDAFGYEAVMLRGNRVYQIALFQPGSPPDRTELLAMVDEQRAAAP